MRYKGKSPINLNLPNKLLKEDMFWTLVITLGLISGQLIKIPLQEKSNLGITLLDLAVFLLCCYGLFRLGFKLKKPPLWIWSMLFFMLIGFFSLMATPLKLSFFEYIISFSYLVRLFFYVFFGWVIFSGGFPKLKENIPQIIYTSGTILAILGLIQYIFLPDLSFLAKYGWDPHYFRAVSTFLDPNFLGNFLVLCLITLNQLQKKQKWFYIAFLVIYLCLMHTFSRGAFLAFGISFAAISILNKSVKQLLITFILFSLLILRFHTYQLNVALPKGVDRKESAVSRVNSWNQGSLVFLRSPFWGVGYNAYQFALKQYHLAGDNFLKGHGSTTNDSSFLYVLATTGVIGFLSYLFYLYALMKKGFQKKVLPAALAGIIAQSFFINTLFYPPIFLGVILMAV